MPFTLSHPAAVLPLRRLCPRRLDFTALVIGSMTPDLGYYLPGVDLRGFTHSFGGSFLWCLPTGLLLYLLWQRLKQPLCFLLPQPHRAALMPLAATRPGLVPATAAAAAISLLLGAWSHTVWDAFTHSDGWGPEHIPLLHRTIHVGAVAQYSLSYCLQWLSSALGALLLLTSYRAWLRRQGALVTPKRQPGDERWRYRLLAVLGVAAVAGPLPWALSAASAYGGFLAWRAFLFEEWVHAASLYACLLVACALPLFARHGQQPA